MINTRIRTYTKCRKNGANSYLLVNITEILKFKAKNSEIVASPLCLGNISKEWSVDNIKKQDLMVMSMILALIMMLLMLMILDIHKYLMKKNN